MIINLFNKVLISAQRKEYTKNKKYNMKQNIYILFLLLAMLACSEEGRIFNADKILRIGVEESDINKEYIGHASKLIDSVTYIPLETTQECLISEITKLIFADKFIYICDKNTNSLYQFDINGRFVRQIGQIGQGSNEYIRINSFDVNKKNGNISIYCEIKQSIFEYDYTGEHIKVEKIGLVISDFIYYKEHYLFYCSWFPNDKIFDKTFPVQYRLVSIHDGKVNEQYLEYKYNEYLSKTVYASSSNGLYEYNGNIMLIERATNTIYKIEHDTISPIYAVDFGKYNIPFDMFSPKASKAKIDELVNLNLCSLSKFYETNDLMYIRYSISHYNRLVCNSIFLKKSKEMINIGPLWINDIDNIAMPSIIAATDDVLIGYFEAPVFYNMVKNNNRDVSKYLIELAKIGDESDNPIICVVNLKKRQL
jgi:hypothetical protein